MSTEKMKAMLDQIPMHSGATLGFSEVGVTLRYSVQRHNLGSFLAKSLETGWSIGGIQAHPPIMPMMPNLPDTYVVTLLRWAIDGDCGFGRAP